MAGTSRVVRGPRSRSPGGPREGAPGGDRAWSVDLPVYVLDAWALVAWILEETPAFDKVQGLLDGAARGECRLTACLMNLGEAYYILRRRSGAERADEARDALLRSPIEVHPVTDRLVWDAAALKSDYPISFADAFAAALAIRLDATLVSGDPDFQALDRAGRIRMEMLARKGR